MSFIKPSTGRIRALTIDGVDLREYTQKIAVFENIKKPYLTARVTILDNNNLIDNMNLVGGEQLTFTFDSPPNDRTYTGNMNLLTIKGRQSPNNLKTQIYDIEFIGQTYFKDQANIIQKSFGQVTATQAVQNIWNQYLGVDPLQILEESAGMMGKQDDPSTIENHRPLSAIKRLMKFMVFPQSQNGVPLLFRDRDNVKLAPLENLFQNLQSQEFFLQKETWGRSFMDPLIYNAIIEAHPDVDPDSQNPTGGRSSVADLPRTVNQSQIVFDHFNGNIAVNRIASQIASGTFSGKSIENLIMSVGSQILTGATGGLGGSPNVQTTQSNRWSRGTAPDVKTMQERNYAAVARSGPQLKLKVPLQSGINVTVGQGIQVQLMPPMGDLTSINSYSYDLSGLWLVKELVHEAYGDNRELSGLSYFTLMRGGLSS